MRNAKLLSTMLTFCCSIALIGLSPSSTASANSGESLLLEFSSKNCGYCQEMKPVVRELVQAGIPVRTVDVDRESEMAVRFGIRMLPTYVVITDGKESSRLVGVQQASAIETAIRKSSQVRLTPTAVTSSAPSAAAPRPTPGGNLGLTGPAAEPMPSMELAQAVARAEAATVRLRVFEDVGYGVGTGTIIDRKGDEYLVLTCGHLFRDNQGKTRVEVDLFYGGQPQTFPGQVLDYHAKDRDIALVTVRAPIEVVPVPVSGDSNFLRNGDSVFSFGCDRGADPSRRDTMITGINKYNQHLKLSNVEIKGAPIDGRSGGGLFNNQGVLIGVCNAADYDDNIGIYAGPGEIGFQLQQCNLTSLLSTSGGVSGTVQLAAANTPSQPNPRTAALSSTNSPLPARDIQATWQDSAPPAATNPNMEMIIVWRDRTRPHDPPQVKVIANPTQRHWQAVQD